jgi:transposase InsO family protein
VHGDLCGPVTLATPGGRRYFLLLIDDLSCYMWVVVLGSKGEAADAIRRVQAVAEAECGSKLCVLRTDNGGEFTTAEFVSYCADEGVQRHYSAPYSPQQKASSSGATRWLWGWLGPSSSRGECLLSSGERRW